MSREATIQRIISVEPIENSDFLDAVKVLGWQVVTQRNQFNVGDLCIYVELDSQLPEKPEFEFLRKDNFRIKTKKLRGALSQGIVFPMTILNAENIGVLLEEGMDMSDTLGITHYEKPVPANMRGLIKGNFPPYIPKTDEKRLQNYPDVLKELSCNSAYATIKCDGTSITFGYKDGEFSVCSRNNALKLEGNESNIYIRMAKQYELEKKLSEYAINMALQGELCGEGIQKNHLGIKGHKVLIFNIWFIDEQRYANYDEMRKICKDLWLEMVPELCVWPYFKHESIEDLLSLARGVYVGTENHREGIVIRPCEEMYSKIMNGRLSFKVINNDYLEKFEK